MGSLINELEHAELLHVLGYIDRKTPRGRRDYLLLRLLFETGAQAQEMASVRTSALQLERPSKVRLLGKGRKERICSLRPETVPFIREQLCERGVAAGQDVPLFAGRHGEALHLLRAGNELSVVKSWLGHVSIVTTDLYMEIDDEIKRKAIEATEPVAVPKRQPIWKRDRVCSRGWKRCELEGSNRPPTGWDTAAPESQRGGHRETRSRT